MMSLTNRRSAASITATGCCDRPDDTLSRKWRIDEEPSQLDKGTHKTHMLHGLCKKKRPHEGDTVMIENNMFENGNVRQSEQTFRSRDESQPLAVFSCSQEYSTPTHIESRLQTV